MAYSTINVTIDGLTLAAIDVTGDGLQVILEESLSDYDKTVMDAISLAAGATFADKMAAYTHPATGITADVLYADFVRVTADYNVLRTKAGLTKSEVAAQLADHEARITTLEP